jgi:hypothetical protein
MHDKATTQPAGTLHFECPFTGVLHAMHWGVDSPVAATVSAHCLRRPAQALHPLLTATLHPTHIANLSRSWQVWRTLYKLHTLGWLRAETAVPAAGAEHGRHATVIVEIGAQLAALGPRATGSNKRLPAYAVGEGCSLRNIADWLAYCSELQTGTGSAGREGAAGRYTTHEEEIAALKIELAERIARKHAANIDLRRSTLAVCDMLEDLSVQSGWTELWTERLQACTTKRPPALPWLTALRNKIIDFYPQEEVIGHRAAMDAELVLQNLAALILEAAKAYADRAMCAEEEEFAAQAARSARETFTVDTVERGPVMQPVLPVGHSQSKSAQTVAARLRAALRAQDTVPVAPAAPVRSPMAALLAKARAAAATTATTATATTSSPDTEHTA